MISFKRVHPTILHKISVPYQVFSYMKHDSEPRVKKVIHVAEDGCDVPLLVLVIVMVVLLIHKSLKERHESITIIGNGS